MRYTDCGISFICGVSYSARSYGQDNTSRIFDPADATHPQRIFTWLICTSYDDKGNVVIYEYKAENTDTVDQAQANERNRTPASRSANRYLKRIKYGNLTSHLAQPDFTQMSWMFEVVCDYGEHDTTLPTPAETQPWLCRNDPFSSYRRLPDETRLPFDLAGNEAQEACRALKGSLLRQEIYALDGTDAEDRPYTVSEHNYTIELLQPQGTNSHAVHPGTDEESEERIRHPGSCRGQTQVQSRTAALLSKTASLSCSIIRFSPCVRVEENTQRKTYCSPAYKNINDTLISHDMRAPQTRSRHECAK